MSDTPSYSFLRTQVVALVATGVDFAVTATLLWLLPASDLSTAAATALAAMTGAAVACTLNHVWSFRGNGNRPAAVARRYAVVWVASLALNTAGTVLLSHILQPVMAARIVTAVAVGCLWNYPLCRYFVYRHQ